MATITYATDSTTLALNGYVFTGFIAGDYVELAPLNDANAPVDSADGVSITKRADGDVHTLTVRVQKGSQDDIFLNSALAGSAPTVFAGSLKENYTIDGVDAVDTWTLEGGAITTRPTETKNNQDGNTSHEYMIRFRFATRAV